jgi:biopolymer transport protein ExbD
MQMRKLPLILLVLITACTAKKTQEQEIFIETTEEQTAPAKKYVYVDSAEQKEATVFYDSATSIVEAPIEEVVGQPTNMDNVDTAVYRWSLSVAEDSVAEWKRMRQFEYVKNLDSLLQIAKNEAETKKQKQAKKDAKRKKSNSGDGEVTMEEPYADNSPGFFSKILNSHGLQVFLWILAGSFVLFVVYKLFVTGSPLQRRSKSITQKLPDAAEEIITSESDFERLIREAIQQTNYRLAVRYQYLKTLHALAQKNYFQLAVDKTNYNYVTEIKDHQKQNDFASLTLNYEYVWYGEFNIDASVYNKLKAKFEAYNSKI